MFALGLHYLNGWAMAAADGARKERAEWPPHPDRVYMALAAAWFETGRSASERDSLLWLETLNPPSITASEATERHSVKVFVPVNDTSSPFEDEKKGSLATPAECYPLGRPRRDRRFAVAIPHDPNVYLSWPEELPPEFLEPLTNLCQKVISVGHPASLVQMWVETTPPLANWIPVEGIAPHRLRVFDKERLSYLERRCNRDTVIFYRDLQGRLKNLAETKKSVDEKRKAATKILKGAEKKAIEAPFKMELAEIDRAIEDATTRLEPFFGAAPISLRPEPGLWQGYGKPTPAEQPDLPGSLFDPRLVVLALTGQRLSLHSTLKLTEALRGAMLAACPEPIPEWLSGHSADGRASARPHVALLPLPFVGHEHADGRVMGLALALPREADSAAAAAILEPWLRDEYGFALPFRLFNAEWLDCLAELETRESPPVSLRAGLWTRPARRWASVTPVVLDRHCDGKDKWEKAAEIVKDACQRIGLPRPSEVLLHPVALVEGAPHASEFPYLTRKSDGGRMHHAHAVLWFDEPVAGPVLIGAGRFRGYGLCRPLPQGGENHG